MISTTFKLLYCLIILTAAFLLFTKSTYAADEHLLINEVYPSPVDASEQDILTKEWIELFNPTDSEIDLSNYILKDKANHIFSDLTGETIEPNEYLTVIDENVLNNTGDSVFLFNDAFIIDQVVYGDTTANPSNAKIPPLGKSITRIAGKPDTDVDSNDFMVADSTPGEEYSFIATEPGGETIDIEDARDLENGKEVTITGIVTVLPGTLSSQYFYIQDATGGIQIYNYGKDFPTLTLGDSISVSGELSEVSNDRRIKITEADKIVILNHTVPLSPAEINISDIGEKEEGTYVKTAGIVTKTSGDTFYISDGTKEIEVSIKKTTGIDKPKMKKGDQVEVMGIVSQYKDDYRILPIDQDDVKIVASENLLPKAGCEIHIYFIISLISTILWNMYLRAKRKLAT